MKKLLLFMGTLIPYLSFGQDGTLDQTFATNGYALAEGSYTAKAVKIQSDGKIVTCGAKSNVDGTDFCVVRFNTNGSLDNTFGTNGISLIDFDGKTDEAFDLSIQNDGKIVVVGGASIANNNDFATVRLNTNGSLDNTFGTNGKVTTDIQNKSTDVAYKVAIQADGKIVIIGDGGSDMFSRNAVVRYTSSGSLDNTFDTDGKLVGLSFAPFTITTLTDMKVLNDGKLIISGSSSNQPAICKLNTDGTFDITFNTTGKLVIPETIFGGNLSFIGIQADGKLVISYGSGVTSEIKLFRIQANGSLDTDFGNAGKASVNIGANNEYTMGINVLSNGKIIVCGSTYANTSNTDFFVARLTSKGELDNTFGTNGFTITSISPTEGDRAEGMAMQADGKIIVAGNKCTGSCNYVVLRYNNTGASSSLNSLNNFTNCQVYPNPATNQVNISLPNNTYQTQVTITNLTGKVLINKLFETNTNLNINTEILNKGVYVIFIENNGMVTQKKLVIE